MATPGKHPDDLTAVYASPDNAPFTVAESVPAPASASVADKTLYLQALRQAVGDVQARINRELTFRMQEDNAAADRDGAAKPAVDEAKEEENYGEEVSDED